jgi:hypothetical protein
MRNLKDTIFEKLKISNKNQFLFDAILNAKDKTEFTECAIKLRDHISKVAEEVELQYSSINHLYTYKSGPYSGLYTVYINIQDDVINIGTANEGYVMWFSRIDRTFIERQYDSRGNRHGMSQFGLSEAELEESKGIFVLPREFESEYDLIKDMAK